MDHASDDEILIDRRAFLDAEDGIVAAAAGTPDLKGIGQGIEAFALRSLKP